MEVTQRRGRANEPSSSFFLPLPSPPFPPSPSIAIRRPPLIPHCAFALPLILFVLSPGTEEAVGPSCVPFGSYGRLSFSLSMSFSSSPFCPFYFSSLLPVAATFSTRLLLPLLITSLLYLVHVVRVEFVLFLVYLFHPISRLLDKF